VTVVMVGSYHATHTYTHTLMHDRSSGFFAGLLKFAGVQMGHPRKTWWNVVTGRQKVVFCPERMSWLGASGGKSRALQATSGSPGKMFVEMV